MTSTIGLNFKTLRKNQVKKINLHDKRGENDKRKHSNKNIDTSKSKDNITLIDRGNAVKFVDELIKRDYNSRTKTGKLRKIKDDAIHAVTAVVQLGGLLGAEYPQHDKHKIKALEEAHKELVEMFGEKNVIHSAIHLDETNPHLHFSFVPLSKSGKLSVAEVIGDRGELKNKHSKFLGKMQERCAWASFERKDDQSLNGLEQGLYERLTKAQKKRQKELDEIAAKQQLEGASLEEARKQNIVDINRLNLMSSELDKREKAVEGREVSADEREHVLNSREGQFRMIYEELQDRTKNVIERDENLRVRENEIDLISSKLEEREKAVEGREMSANEREGVLNARENEMDLISSKLEEREKAVEGREVSADEREGILNGREEHLEKREELFNVSIGELQELAEDLRNQMISVKELLRDEKMRLEEVEKTETELNEKEKMFVDKMARLDERLKLKRDGGLEL